MARPLDIQEFLAERSARPVVDVRSPAEYEHGRVRGAHNLPLFSNEERARVGTLYKQTSREEAIMAGLRIIGPKMEGFARAARELTKVSDSNDEILVHCWRGGMRSASMAWLFETVGLRAATLSGGYKSYRRFMLETLATPRPLIVLGGLTGAGKTALLHAIAQRGETIIDLEDLARHRGSAFGALGMPEQLSTEQFENELGEAWLDTARASRVWIEDESHSIGRNYLPPAVYASLKSAPLLYVDVPLEERVATLVAEYGNFDRAALMGAVNRIRKRLGGGRTTDALLAVEQGDYARAARLILEYYDGAYHYALKKFHTGPITRVKLKDANTDAIELLLDAASDAAFKGDKP